MWFYNDPSLYDKLVRQRGWSVDRFQAWLTEALQVQLLGKAPMWADARPNPGGAGQIVSVGREPSFDLKWNSR